MGSTDIIFLFLNHNFVVASPKNGYTALVPVVAMIMVAS